MTILITGATGLIGTQLTAILQSQGHKIHYLTTRSSKIESTSNYQGFLWNVSQQTIDAACLEGVECIVHLAGATVANKWTKTYKQEILDSRIDSITLLNATLKQQTNKVKHIVSASGISIYPGDSQDLFTEQSTQEGNDFLANVTKAWEAAADSLTALNIKLAKVRTGVVFDPSQGALPKIAQPIRYGAGAVLGSGDQWISWIHLQDICGIYSHIIAHQLEGVYNAVAPEPVTNKALTQQIAKALKKPLFLPAVPAFFLKLLLGERSALVLEGPKVSSQKIKEAGYTFEFPEVKSAIAALLK